MGESAQRKGMQHLVCEVKDMDTIKAVLSVRSPNTIDT